MEYIEILKDDFEMLVGDYKYYSLEYSYLFDFISYMNLEIEYQYFRENAIECEYDDVPLLHFTLPE